MQTAELVELAALLAFEGSALTAVQPPPPLGEIEVYWTASKCRFDRWSIALGRLKRGERPLFDGPGSPRGLLEEILGSEVLTRVWTAIVAAHDRARGTQDDEIVARSIYIGHLEMRQRVLRILLDEVGLDRAEAVRLNRLRRRIELWTDMLLAALVRQIDVHPLAHEPDRVRRYENELGPLFSLGGGKHLPAILLRTTVQTGARGSFGEPSPCADVNAQIAASVVKAFPASLFDSFGLLRSAWIVRLAQTADDTQRLVDAVQVDWAKIDDTTAPLPSLGSRRFR